MWHSDVLKFNLIKNLYIFYCAKYYLYVLIFYDVYSESKIKFKVLKTYIIIFSPYLMLCKNISTSNIQTQ